MLDNDGTSLCPYPVVDLCKNVGIRRGISLFVPGMDMHDGSTFILAANDFLCYFLRLNGNVGIDLFRHPTADRTNGDNELIGFYHFLSFPLP